jgi:hypothetical protein
VLASTILNKLSSSQEVMAVLERRYVKIIAQGLAIANYLGSISRKRWQF